MYRFNVAAVREAAEQRGDKTPYAVAKTAGISTSSAYRILGEQTQPDLNSAMRLTTAYGLSLEDCIDEVDEDEEPAGVAA